MGVATTAPHLYTRSLGRVTGAFCCIHFDKSSLLVTILANYIFILTGHSLVAIFNYKIYTHIRTHQKKKLNSKQQSRLQQDIEMFIFHSGRRGDTNFDTNARCGRIMDPYVQAGLDLGLGHVWCYGYVQPNPDR